MLGISNSFMMKVRKTANLKRVLLSESTTKRRNRNKKDISLRHPKMYTLNMLDKSVMKHPYLMLTISTSLREI